MYWNLDRLIDGCFLTPKASLRRSYQGDTNVIQKREVKIKFSTCTTKNVKRHIKTHSLIHTNQIVQLFLVFIVYSLPKVHNLQKILISFNKLKIISEETSLLTQQSIFSPTFVPFPPLLFSFPSSLRSCSVPGECVSSVVQGDFK